MDELSEKGPKDLILAIVGNKIDLLNHAVSVTEAEEYAKSHNAIFKLTSAKEDKGINELFDAIAGQLDGQNNSKGSKNTGKSLKQEKGQKGKNKKCC